MTKLHRKIPLLLLTLLLVGACGGGGDSGGGTCWEAADLAGAWQVAEGNYPGEIIFDAQGNIIYATRTFTFMEGRHVTVDCNGDINGDYRGEIMSSDRIQLNNFTWAKR
ncbi:MAG: hypothetical protein KQJ78_02695 [Deltaproteobacteria bacterium]|nr:hypothetical protein [Deltaproteobacteria bacterium]